MMPSRSKTGSSYVVTAMNRVTSAILLASTLLLCCCSTTRQTKPEIAERTDQLIRKGIRAAQQQDISEAELFFAEALTISASIEDQASMTRVLINQARLYRLNNMIEKASKAIDAAMAINRSETAFNSELAYEKALLELAKGNHKGARQWADQAVANERGMLAGVRLNLLARIMLIQAEQPAALKTALEALQQNRKNDLIEEEGNSLRLIGSIYRDQNRLDQSKQFLEEALRLDKTIGKSAKIASDLEELAKTCLQAGQPSLSISYLQRAQIVNQSGGRLERARRNQSDLERIRSKSVTSGNRDEKRSVIPAPNQGIETPPATTSPSSRP